MLPSPNTHDVGKNPFGVVNTLFQILVCWVTISDWPFSVSRHNLLYSKMPRECPSIFNAESDVTLPDSCLDTTFFVPSVQNRCGGDGIISCFQELVLLTSVQRASARSAKSQSFHNNAKTGLTTFCSDQVFWCLRKGKFPFSILSVGHRLSPMTTARCQCYKTFCL